MADNWSLWECRLCEAHPESQAAFLLHLEGQHQINLGTITLRTRLHAAKDTVEYSENTFGVYSGDVLMGIFVRHTERAADDPMRFQG